MPYRESTLVLEAALERHGLIRNRVLVRRAFSRNFKIRVGWVEKHNSLNRISQYPTFQTDVLEPLILHNRKRGQLTIQYWIKERLDAYANWESSLLSGLQATNWSQMTMKTAPYRRQSVSRIILHEPIDSQCHPSVELNLLDSPMSESLESDWKRAR